MKKKLFVYPFLLILFAWILMNLDTAGKLLGEFIQLISPFLIGGGIAYLINMVLRPLEELWKKKTSGKKYAAKLMRPVCLSMSVLLILGVLFIISFIVAPALVESMKGFIEQLPDYIQQLDQRWQQLAGLAGGYGISLPEINWDSQGLVSGLRENAGSLQDVMAKITEFLKTRGAGILSSTLGATSSFVAGLVNVVIALIFALYLLAEKETIAEHLDEGLRVVLSQSRYEGIKKFLRLCDESFSSFFSGQLADAFIIGVLCFIGMMIFRFPYAGVISVLVGFTALIPVFGAWLGGGLGALLILLTQPEKAIWFIVFLLTLQTLEENLVYPRVVGQSVGLPGILVLMAVTIGGSAGGVLGMLFAVPLCAVFYELWKEYLAAKKEKMEAGKEVIEEESMEAGTEADTEAGTEIDREGNEGISREEKNE